MDCDSYDDLRQSMRAADPRLTDSRRRTSPPSQWLPRNRARPRVILMCPNANGSFTSQQEFSDANSLQVHFKQSEASKRNTAQRSIYILEALSGDFVSVLGSHFHLHPTIFMDHERLVAFNNRTTGEGNGVPFLPSAINGRDYVSLKYHEPLLLSPSPTDFRNLCDVSGRHIAATRTMGKFSDVGVVRRKCTWWSKKTAAGGWQCLIICDPPVTRVLTHYSGIKGYNITSLPYNSGYIDFMPQSEQMKCGTGPPRTSLVDDIVFYLCNHSKTVDLADPIFVRVFIEKLIASHYQKVAEFLQTTIDLVQFSLSRRHDLTTFAISSVEEQWSDIQALERRIGEYKDDLAAVMMQFRVSTRSSGLKWTTDWRDSAIDFQYLYSRFQEIDQRANNLNGSVAALAGLINNRQVVKTQELELEVLGQSIREAKSVKALTILVLVFVPLAYVSSLFSMSDPYRPGQRLFWLYFVIAIPLIGLIIFGYYTLELGYTDGDLRWSLRTVARNFKERVKLYR